MKGKKLAERAEKGFDKIKYEVFLFFDPYYGYA